MSEPKKDYYGILGIEKDADESKIKKAYYKLAQKWHPDKNPDNRDVAESKFKEISEAYGVLSDPDKKQKYDQFGLCDGEAPDFTQGFPDLSELFAGMGGMGGFPFGMGMGMGMGMGGMEGLGGKRSRHKPFQEVLVKLKVSDIFNGLNKNIDINYQDKCNVCDGTGSKTKSTTTCAGCKGTGIKVIVRQIGPGMIQQSQTICNECNGKGKYVEKSNKCEKCNGKGTCDAKLNKTLNITKNFDHETVMLLKNSGNYDPDTDTKADINIKFIISDIDRYNMSVKNSHDLIMEYPINIYDALTGYSMYWDSHPDGNKYHFKLNNVIKDGDVVFIKNLGLPINDRVKKRGKLYIKFNYIYPSNIMTHDVFKTFIKNKDDKIIGDKDSYIKEKIYDIKDDVHDHKRHHATNTSNTANNRGEQHDNAEIPGCQQS